jgi:hypothetical protein
MLAETLILVGAILALVLMVLLMVKPKRLMLSVGAGKLVHLFLEADAGDETKGLPPSDASG